MEEHEDAKPPLFRSWSKWYWLVFLIMVAQLAIYLAITLSFK